MSAASETVRVRGRVVIQVTDAAGRLLAEQHVDNLVVDRGLALIALWHQGTGAAITLGAVGTGGTAPTPDQTALLAEVYRTTLAQRTVVGNAITSRLYVPTNAANGTTLREAGLFASDGTLYSRITYDPIVKTSQVAVTYLWTHTYDRG